MNYRFAVLVLAVLACGTLASMSQAQEALPADATLASLAHEHGVRGGDLAEALGLPRGTDKSAPMREMGVSQEQLRDALAELGTAPGTGVVEADGFDTSMSIGQVAGALGITGKEFAHDVGVSIDRIEPGKSLAELGVTQARLDQAVRHNLAHHQHLLPSGWKYPIFTLVVLFALMYLLKWGIPRNADPRKRKSYYANWVYVVVLVSSVVILGFLLGKSPNPMEGTVKVFKATVGLYASVWVKLAGLAFFLALALVANKAICGWACPFGALEELIYMLPLFKKAKRVKLPFWVTNTVRAGLFVVFLLLLYGVVGDKKGFVTYHYLNPFNLFNLDFSTPIIWYFIGAYLLVSFFVYRPFCRFICPFGLVSWLFERVSLTRIHIDRERCTDCGACAQACPLTAAGDRLSGKALPADCFSCMRCLRVCPADAIHYRPAWGPPSRPPVAEAEEVGEAA